MASTSTSASTPSTNTSRPANKKRRIVYTPDDVISSTGCTAEALSQSDQHVTFLLRHGKRAEDPDDADSATERCSPQNEGLTQSLIKLTLVPYHKSLQSKNQSPGDAATAEEDAASTSASILAFLAKFHYRLTSESGAEYSYYDATHRSSLASLVAGGSSSSPRPRPRPPWTSTVASSLFGAARNLLSPNKSSGTTTVGNQQQAGDDNDDGTVGFKVELISPASERQIARSMPPPSRALVEETRELYETVTKRYIESIVAGGSLSWIQNVVEGKKEKERLLLDREDWILNIDTKWRSHPDPHAVPRGEWHGHESTRDLYCLGIVKFRDGLGLASLRDLRARHVPLLRAMMEEGTDAIHDIYGVECDQIRVFVHYQPQFYHFHVHFTRIANEVGAQVERGHLLRDIVQNLEMDSDFYVKRTITYALPVTDKLFRLIQTSRKEESMKENDG